MYIEKLSWDSNFFGYPVGKLEISDSEKLDKHDFHRIAKPFHLVYVFSSIPLDIHFLKHIDTKLVLSKKLKTSIQTDPPKNICSYSSKLHPYKDLKRLALESGIYSRYKIDSNFTSNQYERLYTKWINRLAKEEHAFNISIYYKNERILGFASVEKKTAILADIGLVAVDASVRGMGVGTMLVEDVVEKAVSKGFKYIQVVTQAANTSAMTLYKKCNFNVQERKYIYHYWNK